LTSHLKAEQTQLSHSVLILHVLWPLISSTGLTPVWQHHSDAICAAAAYPVLIYPWKESGSAFCTPSY